MSKFLENLGQELVKEEIASALELYADDFYKKAFAIPELRQKLIDSIFRIIQQHYNILNYQRKRYIKPKLTYYSLELRLSIEKHIHQEIPYILRTHSDLVSHLLNQKEQPQYDKQVR